MIYTAETVITHAEQIWADELAFFEANRADMLQITRGQFESNRHELTASATVLRAQFGDVRRGIYNFESTAPLLSTALFEAACRDLAMMPDNRQRIANLTNTYTLPMSGIEVSDNAIQHGSHSEYGAAASCANGETQFVNAYEQIISDVFKGHDQLTVYHDGRGEPLILRKKAAVSSGLTLTTMGVDGVTIPPGTIVGLDESMKQRSKLTGQIQKPDSIMSTYIVDNLCISPSRLSPWAFDNPLSRAMFAMDLQYASQKLSYDDGEREAATQVYDLGSFRRAAYLVINACNTA